MSRERERPRHLSPIGGVRLSGSERREGEPLPVSVFMFPGQGRPSQVVRVAEELWRSYSLVKKMYQDASNVLGYSLDEKSFHEQQLLEKTEFAQPAIFVGTLAAYRVYEQESKTKKGREKGFNSGPTFLAGHSVGEIAAAVASGALSFLNGVDMIKVRGEAMQKASDIQETGMMPVIGTKENLKEFFKEFPTIDLCLINAEKLVVIGGPLDDLRKASEWLRGHKMRSLGLLDVSAAFHSRYMEPARSAITQKIQNTVFTRAETPIVVVENGKAKTIQDPWDIKKELVEQTTQTFDWNSRLSFINNQNTAETVELAQEDLSEIIKRANGGAYERITTRLGAFVGSRWRRTPTPQVG